MINLLASDVFSMNTGSSWNFDCFNEFGEWGFEWLCPRRWIFLCFDADYYLMREVLLYVSLGRIS